MACWYVHIQTYDFRAIFLLGASYLLTDAGAICSDEGIYVVNVDECRLAVPFIQTMYPGAVYSVSYSSSNHPKGCFLHIPNNNVYFNTHSTGTENSDDRPFCKSNGK